MDAPVRFRQDNRASSRTHDQRGRVRWSPATDPPPRRILVVDDVPEILDLFKGLVRRIRTVPVELVTEVNSARAKAIAEREPFDLVLSDFRMRQVDGVEVLQAAHATNPGGRRILMTGYNEVPTEIARIQTAHIDAYVQKPLKSADVLQLMLDFLQGNQEAIDACQARARELEAVALKEETSLGLT
jgi:response regulator RpfG family c-di-GMP phosphodiesterase